MDVTPHLPLVRRLAEIMHARLPKTVRVEDLIGYGHVGLVQAGDSYDPRRNTAFGTYARRRINGAMLDGLREMNWFKRARWLRGRNMTSFSALRGPRPEHDACGDMSGGQHTGFADSIPAKPTRHAFDVDGVAKGLSKRSRFMLQLLYEDGLTMKEVGMVIGLTESRVSQMHKESLALLRERMSDPILDGDDGTDEGDGRDPV